MTVSDWLVGHQSLLPSSGDALDVACGRGRNALWLAQCGLRVRALDRDAQALEQVHREARRAGVHIDAELFDFERPGISLGRHAFDLIVVIHYLHRPLFPPLIEALRPDGLLIYETFTLAQAARGKPTNPDFLLEPGELRRLVTPLKVVDYREGPYDGRDVAGIVARRGRGQV